MPDAPAGRLKRAMVRLGILLLIIHCRPWSYTLFEGQSEDNVEQRQRCGSARPRMRATSAAWL
jgi:hypothetical protein